MVKRREVGRKEYGCGNKIQFDLKKKMHVKGFVFGKEKEPLLPEKIGVKKIVEEDV